MRFEPQNFENLKGLDLGHYTLSVAKEGLSESEFLPYFEASASSLDLPHLETALYWLGEIATERSYEMVARYLNHPAVSVRFIASKTIAKLPSIDEHLMKCVVSALSQDEDETGLSDLRLALDRPATPAARCLAEEFKSKRGTHER